MSQKIKAPAKINLRLKVTGRRADGFHLLDMVMARIDLADEIRFEVTSGESDSFESDSPEVPRGPSNTLLKAVDKVRQASGRRFGTKIFLHKRIPTAAGLGGGSSDAAAFLKALNEVLKLGWDRQKLIEIGVRIGADVPFFLAPEPAQRVRGIGEILEPIGLPKLPLILINPGFPVSTADAYRWYDASAGGSGRPLERAPSKLTGEVSGASFPALLGELPPLENDLEGVVIPRYPVLARAKESLMTAGALGALMSGSGPTVFGLFKSAASRDRGYKKLLGQQDPRWWMCKAVSLRNSGVV